jgi:hypothetical protein
MILTGLLCLIVSAILLLSFINKPCTVYLAQPMSGYDKEDMVQVVKMAKFVFEQYGLQVWSPVIQEGVSGRGPLDTPSSDLDWIWPMDKSALRWKCFVFVNLEADKKSFGCENEYGIMRYCYWRPSLLVSVKHAAGYKSIASYEADALLGELHSAARHIRDNWGTFWQRRLWQARMYSRSSVNWLLIHTWGLGL